MTERQAALEEAAAPVTQVGNLYGAYAKQEHRAPVEREAFQRDWQTCADLANRIRALARA